MPLSVHFFRISTPSYKRFSHRPAIEQNGAAPGRRKRSSTRNDVLLPAPDGSSSVNFSPADSIDKRKASESDVGCVMTA
jgi:hypothetical protein